MKVRECIYDNTLIYKSNMYKDGDINPAKNIEREKLKITIASSF